MSKFACRCGEVIRDQTDKLPYKGYLFADTEYFDLFDRIAVEIAGFIEARVSGKEREWLDQHFTKGYPSARDHEIVQDIITHMRRCDMDVYQCPKCGRLHVARRDGTPRLDSFAPDETPHKDVFRK